MRGCLNLKINTSTDYALRLLIYLTHQNRMISSTELSRKIDISQRYLMQIIAKLRDAGVISVSKGMSGGYILSEDTTRISVYDIVVLMEGISVPGDEDDQRKDTLTLSGAYSLLKNYIETYFQSITLDMLVGKDAKQDQATFVSKIETHIESLKNSDGL